MYLVAGTEPLLIIEACDQIRARARATGFDDREVHFVERGFDWDTLTAGAANLSLFAVRRIIELRLRSAPDAAAARALTSLATTPPEDTLLLISGEMERKSLTTAWANTFDKHGVIVAAEPVSRGQLPEWVVGRLRSHGVTLTDDALQLLVDRVEGNLLAAQQEIERIGLLSPATRLDASAVAELVADNARYDTYELADAACTGNASRALRILSGLRGEGIEPPQVLWALANDLRFIARTLQAHAARRSLDDALQSAGVWYSRRLPVRAAAQRMTPPQVDGLLMAAARADRMAKGSLRGDAWVELERLVARMAGVPLAA